MACIKPGLIETGSTFLKALNDATRLRRNGQNLSIFAGKDRVLRFKAAAKDDAPKTGKTRIGETDPKSDRCPAGETQHSRALHVHVTMDAEVPQHREQRHDRRRQEHHRRLAGKGGDAEAFECNLEILQPSPKTAAV